jgi:putative restriction endonuclease
MKLDLRWNAMLQRASCHAATKPTSCGKPMGMTLRSVARCKVREYWIVDLRHEQVDVYREPVGEGYAAHHVIRRGGTVASLAFPEDAVPVDEILPPPAR